jgi:uncharacterized protein
VNLSPGTNQHVDGSLAAPYLEGLAQGKLRYQVCLDCESAQTLARYACHACQSARLAWRDATGRGTVYAVTVVTRAPSDSFRALVPYTLVLVNLDEGPRLMAHGQAFLKIADRVSAEIFSHDHKPLVRFRKI